MTDRPDNRGFSLIELLIVMALITILLTVAALAFSEWVTKYSIEAQTKQMYADIQAARIRAMQLNRLHCINFTANSMQVQDDEQPSPYGDGACETNVSNDNLKNALSFSAGLPAPLTFDAKGISNLLDNDTQAICTASTASPDYDCITVSQTRINMGKIIVQGGCSAANCQIK